MLILLLDSEDLPTLLEALYTGLRLDSGQAVVECYEVGWKVHAGS